MKKYKYNLKHLLWNYTVRLWKLVKYRNDKWRDFYCSKLYWTPKQFAQADIKIKKLLENLKLTPPEAPQQ